VRGILTANANSKLQHAPHHAANRDGIDMNEGSKNRNKKRRTQDHIENNGEPVLDKWLHGNCTVTWVSEK
jgi:hypothetical protein